MSNAAGSFSSPVALGSVSGTASGFYTINATVPETAAAGTGFRLRVISAGPAVITSDSANLTIVAPPATPVISSSGPANFCSGQTATLTAPEGYTYLWSTGATSRSITVDKGGTYTVTVSTAAGYSATSAPLTLTGGMPTWYKDVDGDGYGNDDKPVLACSAPVGYAARGGDCKGQDPTVYPGAVELLNGIDDNCDGIKDNVSGVTAAASPLNDGRETPGTTSLKVRIGANPTATSFTLLVQSGSTGAVSLKVWDGLGRLVEVRRTAAAGSTLTLGEGYRPGLYLAELRQRRERLTVKLVKQPN
ncbi:MopE-related protein [Paraflavisolibacter sp. H34]|uniref:MopE-related protein n=1 Tax=Huijunlia imazamoxiresistens TaxID=3127457 RepID=UPI003018EF17